MRLEVRSRRCWAEHSGRNAGRAFAPVAVALMGFPTVRTPSSDARANGGKLRAVGTRIGPAGALRPAAPYVVVTQSVHWWRWAQRSAGGSEVA